LILIRLTCNLIRLGSAMTSSGWSCIIQRRGARTDPWGHPRWSRAGLCEFAAQGKPWARCPSKCFAPRYARQMMATFVSGLKYDLSDLVLVLSQMILICLILLSLSLKLRLYITTLQAWKSAQKSKLSGINLLYLPLKSLEIKIFEALFLN
jgi:hypothetical protein